MPTVIDRNPAFFCRPADGEKEAALALKGSTLRPITLAGHRPLFPMTKRRFHFKLEPLRTLRENAELTVMKELAGELDQAAALRAELGSVQSRLVQARSPIDGGATAAELCVRQSYVERMERELDETRFRTQQQEGHVEETRTRLAHAVRERQTLDRLEQRRRAVHDLEARRAERVDTDEISLLRHAGSENVA